MKQFTVIGNPIAHSKSPQIHSAFATQLGIELLYTKLLAAPEKFNDVARQFFTQKSNVGANVTVPFKQDALNFADVLSPAAKLAGAVNTLSKKDNVIYGDNTDGIGLLRDIRDNWHYSLSQKDILILGAGGAVRGVISPFANEKPNSITIANRTLEKAQAMAEQFHDYVPITTCQFNALNRPYDIIINATSASLLGQGLLLPTVIFDNNTLAYDMMYGKQPTAFMQFADAHSANTADGLGMLVEQAAQSFMIWHGLAPDTKPVIRQIRDILNN